MHSKISMMWDEVVLDIGVFSKTIQSPSVLSGNFIVELFGDEDEHSKCVLCSSKQPVSCGY